MPIDPDILKIQPQTRPADADGASWQSLRSFDMATPDTAPDGWKRAAARRISARLYADADGNPVGVPDPDGRVWRRDKGAFATGAEYLDFMRGMIHSGNVWDYAATPEWKDFKAADEAGKLALARKAQGRVERAANAAGKAIFPAGYGLPDDARELKDAPAAVREANARLRAASQERASRDLDRLAFADPMFPAPRYEPVAPEADEDLAARKADRSSMDAWRVARDDAAAVNAHHERLADENLWAVWLAVSPSLSDQGRGIAERAFKDRKLAGADIAGFQTLDEREQAVVSKLARLSRAPTAGTFLNALGDAGIGFLNGVVQTPLNAARQIDTLTTDIDQAVFGKDAGLIDKDELNRRARERQRLAEALDDYVGIDPSGAAHDYLARSVIGAASTIPYMAYAAVPYVGMTTVALDFMQRLDDSVAQEGGDVHQDMQYVAFKLVNGALYAGIERLSALPIFKEGGGFALRTAFVKLGSVHGKAAAEKIAGELLKRTGIETLEEATQALVEEYAKEVGLKLDPDGSKIVAAGIHEFCETLGTMGLVSLIGTGRQGVQARTLKGRQALADYARDTLRRDSFLLTENPYGSDAPDAANAEAQLHAWERINRLRTAWERGGAAELEKRTDLTPEQAALFDTVFEGERAGSDVRQTITGRNVWTASNIGQDGGLGSLSVGDVREIVNKGGENAREILLESGFTEAGSARLTEYFAAERKAEAGIRAALSQEHAQTDHAAEREDALERSAEIQPLRSLYQRAGTRDGAVKAFEALKFSKEQAASLADAFDRERNAATSPAAAAAFRAFYLDASEEESADAVLARMTGLDPVPAPEHGPGAARLTLRGADGAALGRVLFLPDSQEAFDPENPTAGETVEAASRGVITAAQWRAMTPDQRRDRTQTLGITFRGGFTVTDEGDPSVRADGAQADVLTGRLTLGPDAPAAVLYHEATHAWLAVMRRAGRLTADDVKKLQERYGAADKNPGWFNEEAMADDIREIGAATGFTPDQALASRFVAAVRRFAGGARQTEARRTAASGARQALYESIVYGKTFEGVGEFEPAPTAATQADAAAQADPLAGAASPAQASVPASDADPATGTPKPETSPRPPAADPRARQPVAWSAATPQGNVRVGGYWVIAPRERFISDTDPRYDFSLQGRTRDVTAASSEQVAAIAAQGTFDPLRLMDAPDTAGGAMIAVAVTLKNAQGKDETFYMVLSGNGRFRALDQVDADHRGDEYRGPVQAFADERGIPYDPADMTAEARPRLVRVLNKHPAGTTLQQIATLSNQNAILQMSDAEQAAADAELIGRDNAARLFSANKDGLPSKNGSDEFFAWFVRATGDASLTDSKGNPTDTARARARRAMLALAIGQGTRGKETVMAFTENAEALGLERQRDALLIAAGALSALEDAHPDYGISAEISRAAAALLQIARERKAGKTIDAERFLAQGDMLDALSPATAEALRLLDSARPSEGIAEALRRYADLASRIDTSTADMFGEAAASKETLLKKAVADTEIQPGTRYSISLSADQARERDAAYIDAVKRGDEATAQAMVDEAAKAAGYTVTAYKAIPENDWRTGKPIRAIKSTNGPWAGFFTSDKAVADKFGRIMRVPVIASHLRVNAPFVVDANGKTAGEVQFDILDDSAPYAQKNNKSVRDALESGLYDTIVLENTVDEGTVYVPLSSEQIKSADAITRDDAGNVIPLSQRFNPAENDIRYSIALAARRYALSVDMPAEGEALTGRQLEFLFARQQYDPDYRRKVEQSSARRRATIAASRAEKENTRLSGIRDASARAFTNPDSPAAWQSAFDAAGDTVSRIIHQFYMPDGPQRFPNTYDGKSLIGLKVGTPHDAAALLMPLRNPYQESMKAIFLDDDNRVIAAEVCTVGLLDSAPVHPREIFKRGVTAGATSVVLGHNHPSGDPTPSPDDRNITDRLAAAGRILGIEYVDHIITNGESFYSFANGAINAYDGTTPSWEAVPAGVSKLIRTVDESAAIASALRQGHGNHIHAVMLDTKGRITAVTRIPYNPASDSPRGLTVPRAVLRAAVSNPTAAIVLDLTAEGITPADANALYRTVAEQSRTIGIDVRDAIYNEDGFAVSVMDTGTKKTRLLPLTPKAAQAAAEDATRYSVDVSAYGNAAEGFRGLFDTAKAIDPGRVRSVPVSALRVTKNEPAQSVDNAERRMRASAAGAGEARAPIQAVTNPDGTIDVIDGNATALASGRMGLAEVPVETRGRIPGGLTANSALFIAPRKGQGPRYASLDAVYEAAADAAPGFKARLEAAAKAGGFELRMRPGDIKGRERSEQKLREDYGGDASRLLDVLGGTFALEEGQRFGDAVKALEAAGLEVMRIKNEFTRPENDSGYRDVKVNVRVAGGFVGEVILIERGMLEKKKAHGHKIYKEIRDVKALWKNLKDGKEKTALDAVIKVMNRASAAYYGATTESYDTLEADFSAASLAAHAAFSAATRSTIAQAPSSPSVNADMFSNAPQNILPRVLTRFPSLISSLKRSSSLNTSDTTSVSVLYQKPITTPVPFKDNASITYPDGKVNKEFPRYSVETASPDAFDWMREYYDESWGDEQAGTTRDTRERLAREYAAVVAEHTHPGGRRKDTWHVAPNGKPSLLSERNWVKVRTPSFKAWFGDWQADPAGASKVIDENGEPLVVWHGTNAAGFSEFRMPVDTRQWTAEILGHYFSRRRSTAATYSGTLNTVENPGEPVYDGDGHPADIYPGLYPVFLNIRNPHVSDFKGAAWNRLPEGDRWMVGTVYTGLDFMPTYNESGARAVFDDEHAAQEFLAWAKRSRKGKEYSVRRTTTDTRELTAKAIAFGHDGALFKNVIDTGGFDAFEESLVTPEPDGEGKADDVFVAFGNNQIKSANANTGAYSPDTDDIRYSIQTRMLSPADLPESMAETHTGTTIEALAQTKFKDERARHKKLRDAEDWEKAAAYARELLARDKTAFLGQYLLAKYHGDAPSAAAVVRRLAKPKVAERIKESLGDPGLFAATVVYPVSQRESNRVNMLPYAYAQWLSERLGVEACEGLVKLDDSGAPNTGAKGEDRAQREYAFEGGGDIDNGSTFILVDDVWTSGQTLWTAYEHIKAMHPDARAAAFTALAASSSGRRIKPGKNQLTAFLKKANLTPDQFKELIGNDVGKLTGTELQWYILRGARGPRGVAKLYGLADGSGKGGGEGSLPPGGNGPGPRQAGPLDESSRPVRYAIDISGRAYPNENVLVGFMAHAVLTGSSFPSKNTVARLAQNIGVETFNYENLAAAARSLAEETTDTAIKKASLSSDPEKTTYAIGELSRAYERSLVRSGAREGERLGRNAQRIRGLTEDGVRSAIAAVTGADYADIETDTEVDIAASILAADPKKFRPDDEPRQQPAAASADAGIDADPATADAATSGETDEEVPGLTDKQRAEIAHKRRERETRIQGLLDAARDRAARQRFRDTERRRRAAANEAAATEEAQAAPGGAGASDAAATAADAAGAEPENPAAPVDFSDRWEAAAFLRVWAFDRYRRDNPNRAHESRDLAKDRVAVEFYRKTAVRQLRELARKLLEPGAPRENIVAVIGQLTPGLAANQIERASAHIFGLLNRHAVREERRSLVKKFRAELKRQFVKGAAFEELGVDLGRTITGAAEEDARYVMRVCELSDRALDGEVSTLQQERERINAILAARESLTDEDGNPLSVGSDDMQTRRALRQLALLDKYGGMADMMPGEILDLAGQGLAGFAREAEAMRERWAEYDDIVKRIRDPLARSIARGVDDPTAPDTALARAADSLTSMLRQRLDALTRYEADPDRRAAARAAIGDLMDLLGRGNTDYTNAIADDRAALMGALGQVFAKPNGRPDRSRIRAWLRRMDETIPRELAAQLTRQGRQNNMTYGQMLQLLVSLDQWASYRDNIIRHDRKGQAALIRAFAYADPKTGETRRALTNEDAQIIEWLRRGFYAGKRGALTAVTQRIAGRAVDSPDPLYHPVKMHQQRIAAVKDGSASVWQPLAGVFSRRVANRLDFDETASIINMFHDRSHETALLTAFSERGLILREVLTSRQFQDAVTRFHGRPMLGKVLRQTAQALNGGRPRGQGQSASAALAQRVTSYIGIGFNINSAAKQTASLPVFAARLGFRRLGQILFSPIDRAAVARLRDSDEHRARYGTGPASGMNAADRAAYDAPDASAFKRFFGDWGMYAMRKADWVISAWVGQGVYRDLYAGYLDQGMSETDADRRAVSETFNLIEETQQSGRAENLPEMSREHGILGRLAVQFATSPLQQMQYEIKEFAEWRDLVNNGGTEANIKEARNKFMRAMFINHILVPGMLTAITGLYKAATGGEPDWNKEGFHWTLLIDALMGQFSRIFFAGALAEQTLRVLFLRQPPRLGQLIPAEGAIRFAGNLAYPVRDIATWDTEHMRADILRALKSIAVTRLPVAIYENYFDDEK